MARDGLAMPGPAKCKAIITKEIFIGLVPVLLLLLTIKQIHLCAGSGLESKLIVDPTLLYSGAITMLHFSYIIRKQYLLYINYKTSLNVI